MNRTNIAWISALLLAISLPFAATAASMAAKNAPAATKPAHVWDIVAIRQTDGTFGFCRAEHLDTASGLTLALALSPVGEVNMGIKVPDAGFTKGETFPMTLTVEGTSWTKKANAEAALTDLLLTRLGKDDAFLDAMTKGRVLSAKGDVDETRFTLSGGDKMVEGLRACVADNIKNAAAKSPAKPAASPAAPAKTADTAPAGDADLPSGLAALLKEAQLPVAPIKLAGAKEANAVDHAWTVKVDGAELDGGFREARVAATQDFKTLSTGTIDGLKKECKSGLKIKAGAQDNFSQLTMQTYDLTCDKEFVALLVYRTGTDIYGQLLHRGPATKAAAAKSARDRLAAVLRKIGQAAPAEPKK